MSALAAIGATSVLDPSAQDTLVPVALAGLAATAAIAVVTWLVSLAKRDVSIVDSVWSLMIAAAGATYVAALGEGAPRTGLVLVLVAIWAIRLCAYIAWRNRGKDEDRRYAAIRARNARGFALKSLGIVFLLQAVLAWVVSAPLLAAVASDGRLGWLDLVGASFAAFGIAFETVADWQLAQFSRDSANRGRVLDRGLWRYTRHPNYFGEFCVWWGFGLVAVAAGGAWSLASPLLMSVLLLRVSGVALLEKDIALRRPAYREYVATTNAFVPGFPRGRR